jgi:hypothetical protein
MAILLRGAEAARMLRTRAGARAVVVHSGRRIDLDTHRRCARLDTACPEPLRRARRLERQARADAEATLDSRTPPERSSSSVSAQRTHVAGRADQAIRTLERAALEPSPPPASVGSLPGPTFEGGPGVLVHRGYPPPRSRPELPACLRTCRGSSLLGAGRSGLSAPTLRRTGGIELAATTTGSLPDGGL